MLISLLLCAAPVQPQSSQFVEALLLQDEPVPGASTQDPVYSVAQPLAGRGGGWVSTVRLGNSIHSAVSRIVGQRPGGPGVTASILRDPETIQGYVQRDIYGASMADGQIAYLETESLNFGFAQSVWIEDELIAQEGDAVLGQPGWTWAWFNEVALGTSGQLYVRGRALTQGSPPARNLLWSYPSGTVLLAEGDSLAGLDEDVMSISGPISINPAGTSWSVPVVEQGNAGRAIVLDGAVLSVGGTPVSFDEPAPSSLFGPGFVWWQVFAPALLNDRGDLALHASIRNAAGQVQWVFGRNGSFGLTAQAIFVEGIGEAGGLLTSGWNGTTEVRFEGGLVLDEAIDIAIDLDRDGVPEPGVQLAESVGLSMMGAGEGARTLFLSRFTGAGGGTIGRWGVFRARDYRVDEVACEGLVNSTGEFGRMAATGSRLLSGNDVSLRLWGLPVASNGYGLAARAFAITSFPGGSQGNLCLTGPIGRDVNQIYTASASGTASIEFDLSAIPQPMGSVSASAGETWYLQSWYRDSVNGQATSNFTSAIAVQFD